ncbi:hypothetical protein GGR77_000672 [Xanthomonas translucens]
MLNYLEIDEARHFKWDDAFPDLFTLSELESLALDTGLAEALGARFRVARASKKADFIKVLLAAKDFAYPVPPVTRLSAPVAVRGRGGQHGASGGRRDRRREGRGRGRGGVNHADTACRAL